MEVCWAVAARTQGIACRARCARAGNLWVQRGWSCTCLFAPRGVLPHSPARPLQPLRSNLGGSGWGCAPCSTCVPRRECHRLLSPVVKHVSVVEGGASPVAAPLPDVVVAVGPSQQALRCHASRLFPTASPLTVELVAASGALPSPDVVAAGFRCVSPCGVCARLVAHRSHRCRQHAVRCGAVRCGAVRCGAVRCGAVRCGAVRCDA
jgi:hypothetical protein